MDLGGSTWSEEESYLCLELGSTKRLRRRSRARRAGDIAREDAPETKTTHVDAHMRHEVRCN